ncbi:MAG: cell surface protein SprA, partial [Prevotellaceae bacterium]|nr:cell surface protein SprA [Prevotellaceae bacterium]
MFKQSIRQIFRFFLIITFAFAGNAVLAQSRSADSTATLLLPKPEDEETVVYDPDTNSYLYYKKGEEKTGIPFKILSKEEYDKETIVKAMSDSWLKRREESAGKTDSRGGLLPSFRRSVNNRTFEKVFGGSDIVVNFNGKVDVRLGVRSTRINNPLTPPPYRTTISPNFEATYQLNLTGNIGERIKLNFTFDPNSTFDFETNLNIGYKGGEDDILQNLELGNISMPISNSLIMGSRSLFGGRADLRIGKLDITLLASQQRGQSKTIDVKGGAQSREFEIAADEYRANQHFFLSHYFRDNYERALSQRPLITSGINVTKIEVWVTNRTNSISESNNNHRNIVAFMDLAEPSKIFNNLPEFASTPGQSYPSNNANGLYQEMTGRYNLRNFSQIAAALQPLSGRNFTSGKDYEKLERARRLPPSEFTLNSQLGFISLSMPLREDEVLAVAYEYTLNGRTFKVGEISTSGTTGSDSTLILKLIKGTILTPHLPTWKLMMKNIYSLNAYLLKPENFELNIFYEDSELGTAVPYISEGPIDKQPLISVLNLDKVNLNGDAYPDGVFDFVQGITIDSDKGMIIFPVLEPFGRFLESQFKGNPASSKYVYKELYDSTLIKAKEIAEKNKFYLRGFCETSSQGQGEIDLGATNVAEGSVVVTAGGTTLMEGIDYKVNYMIGTVTIINPGYLNSNVPISIKLENREMYNMQTKTMLGVDTEYKFNEKFLIGGTMLYLNEKPMTQKIAYGEEPISNAIW